MKYNQYFEGYANIFCSHCTFVPSFYFISFSCPKDFSLRIFICLLEKDSANNYKHAEQAYIIRRTRELNNVSLFSFFFPLLSFYFRRELKMQHASNASCFNYGRRISNQSLIRRAPSVELFRNYKYVFPLLANSRPSLWQFFSRFVSRVYNISRFQD